MNTLNKGYHIPLHFTEQEIRETGDLLLGQGVYRAIEIKYPYHMTDFQPESYIAGIRGLLRDHHPMVSLHVPTNLDVGHGNAVVRRAIIDEIKRTVDFAADFHAGVLAIHPGTIGTMDIPVDDGENDVKKRLIQAAARKKEQARELTVKAMAELSDYSRDLPLVWAVENVLLPQEIVYTAEDLDGLLREIDRPNVKALFDCGHAFRCGIDPARFVRELQADIAHVHVNDNDGTCDLHLSIGHGNIPFRPLMAALKEKNFTGSVIMETLYRDAKELIGDSKSLDALLEA